ncbi:21364_t:CDS:2, partial [Gigaspora margarita]
NDNIHSSRGLYLLLDYKSMDQFLYMSWQTISGGLSQISVGRGNNVWGVNLQYSAGNWRQIDGAAVNVGVGADGTVWCVNKNDEIFARSSTELIFKKCCEFASTLELKFHDSNHDKFELFESRIDDFNFIFKGKSRWCIIGDKNHVWGVNRQNQIFYRTNGDVNGVWVNVSGALKNVSVAADGTVWGVNGNDDIFRWNGVSWESIAGKLKQIYTSNASYIIGTNSANEIYQYRRGSWFKYDGSLKDVAIGIDGIIWGVNSNDQIFTRQDGGFDGPAFK